MKNVFVFLILIGLLTCSVLVMAENEKGDILPAYVYSGEDPMVGAIANYSSENSSQYADGDAPCVAIPAPVILKTVMIDENHADVYGNFWCMKYQLEDRTLVCVSGGEEPGIMHLEMENLVWTVASVEVAGDGDEYAKDIIRFCAGDKKLEEAYFNDTGAQDEPFQRIRTQLIREYVETNQLPIDAYQDPYWDPVPLFE